ncbi:hypothetical protein [Actinocrispum sp. NPDC049592]|uniref:hypothetical protein n=1 Tax=Actinocrispum sp. NPDC049592 TaxID=3154835 RepID=UPI003418342E
MLADEGVRIGAEAARRAGGPAAPGLTDAEFDRIENEFGFEFADDHRAFLAEKLPLNVPVIPQPGVTHTWSKPWPDWRDEDRDALRERLARPVGGVLFDVEHNKMWHKSWGERPAEPAEAIEVAREHLATVPQLVPVYGHRYLPAGRGTYGHPVLSVVQTDIIYYGTDLADYIHREVMGWYIDPDWEPSWKAEFWGDLF